ncbi:AAA family ATPase [Streptomyces sp. MS191]|uniref:AAA family ATPase n=1 Tax=Streptomyces sp. ms191 TaxID=1827978 RepID=UPI0011CDD473|nr:AAA family ATPase [Streptomyces sp. ms191]
MTFAPGRVAALVEALERPEFGYRCTTLSGPEAAPPEAHGPGQAGDGGQTGEEAAGWWPTAAEVGDAVRGVVTEAGAEGVRIVHVLSHGIVRPTGLFVLGADSEHAEWTSVWTWLSAVEDYPGRPPVLFLLDLCHSGAAARFDFQLRGVTDGSQRAWVIAASGAAELAVQGRFTEAVTDVLNAVADKRLEYDHTRSHLGFLWFVDRVRDRLRELVEDQGGMDHRPTANVLDSLASGPPFLPNPRYDPGPAAGMPPPDQPGGGEVGTESLDEVADVEHFLRHARGGAGFSGRPVPPGDDTGAGVFTGRGAELGTLADWLRAGRSGARLQVVTGSPGSGKSALLGVLMCAVHPAMRSTGVTLPKGLAVTAATIAPPLTIHARQRTLVEIVDSLTRQARARVDAWDRTTQGPEGDPRRFFEFLSRRDGPPPILVLDALDEARDPAELLSELLLPLTALTRPDGGPLCRVLLAARDEEPCSDLIAVARSGGDLIDLDQVTQEALQADLREYVVKLLLPAMSEARQADGDGEAGGSGGVEAFAEATARALAAPRRAVYTGPYLMAALYASYALQGGVKPLLGDPATAAELGGRVPLDLPSLLDLGFARESAHRLLRPVLTALAFAQGDGMPVALVAAVARALVATGRDGASGDEPAAKVRDALPPGPASAAETTEVAGLLRELRAFVRSVPDRTGTVLHRLLHQSVADELRGRAVPADEERGDAESRTSRVVYEALTDTLRGADPDRQTRWAGLDVYLRRHLAQHAFDAGRLDELCAEPHFLVHADPDWLGPELSRTTSEAARSAGAVYRTSAHVHRRTSDEQRRHILAVDALRHEARTLADRLAAPGPGCGSFMPWRPQWATGTRISAAHAFTLELPDDLVTVLAGAVTDIPVVVTGGRSGRLGVWDANNGRLLCTAETGLGEIRALACARIGGVPVVVAAGAGDSLRMHILPGLKSVDVPGLRAEDAGSVRFMESVEVAGRQMAVTADSSGRLLLWDLKGDLPREELHSDLGRTTALVCVPGGNGPSVVVADDEGTLRFCSLLGDTGTERGIFHPGRVNALACVVVDGVRCLASGGEDGVVRIWDLAGRSLRTESVSRHDGPIYSLVGLDAVNGPPLMLSAGSDRTIRLWDVRDGTEHSRFVGHMGPVTALTHLPSTPPVLVSAGTDPALRVWHLPTDRQRVTSPVGHTSWVSALARAVVDEREVLISAGADGLLYRWDLESGEPLESPQPLPPSGAGPFPSPRNDTFAPSGRTGAGRLNAVAVTALEGRPIAVSAGPDGLLRCWDLKRGTPIGEPFTPAMAPVHAVSATVLNGRALVVSAGADGLLHCWDVVTGCRRGLPLVGHVGGVNALACVDLESGPAVLSCGDDGTLRLWDLATGLPVCRPIEAHAGWVTALACSVVDGVPFAVSGGQDGRVRMWDLSGLHTGTGSERVLPFGEPLSVTGGVNAVDCGPVDGALVVVAADDSGVHIWDVASRRTRIDIGVPGPVPALLLDGDRLALGCEWEVVLLRRVA